MLAGSGRRAARGEGPGVGACEPEKGLCQWDMRAGALGRCEPGLQRRGRVSQKWGPGSQEGRRSPSGLRGGHLAVKPGPPPGGSGGAPGESSEAPACCHRAAYCFYFEDSDNILIFLPYTLGSEVTFI